MDCDTFAARHISDDGFAANRIAALGAVDQKVAVAFYDDGIVIAAKDTADHAREAAGGELAVLRQRFATRGREFGQHLPSRILAITDCGELIVGATQSILTGGP